MAKELAADGRSNAAGSAGSAGTAKPNGAASNGHGDGVGAGDPHTPPPTSAGQAGFGFIEPPDTGAARQREREAFEPGAGAGAGGGKRKGGRPAGSGGGKRKGKQAKRKQPIFQATVESSRPAAQKIPSDLKGIEGLLLTIHLVVSNIAHIPELQLSQDEAAKLAEAMQNVAAQYDIAVAQRTIAWMELLIVAGGIYGTRGFAYHLRKQAEEKAKRGQLGPVAVPKQPAASAAANVGA